MGSDVTPYVPCKPGDLITCENWTKVQVEVKKDIVQHIKDIKITDVDHSTNADKLDGKTSDEIIADAVKQAIEKFRQTAGGYSRTFNVLQLCQEKILKHGFGTPPLVDIYQLDYFKVVCAKGEEKTDQTLEWVNFYLYHAVDERRIPKPVAPTKANVLRYVDIEGPGPQQFRLPFKDMLDLYNVSYTDTTKLLDLEDNFWTAFFGSPNYDTFDPDQWCHSPWFEKCCGEKRTVDDLKKGGDWDKIMLKWMPRKTVNFEPVAPSTFNSNLFPPSTLPAGTPGSTCLTSPAPTQIQVVHYDFDSVGIKLLDYPWYTPDMTDPTKPIAFPGPQPTDADVDPANAFTAPPNWWSELKVMVLMKV